MKLVYCPRGVRAEPAAGDVLLVHGSDPLARLAQFGQAHNKLLRTYSYWNHAAMSIGNGSLVESTTMGVHISPVSNYDKDDVVWIRIEATEVQRQEAVRFLYLECGEPYDIISLGFIALFLAFGIRISLGIGWCIICSELVMEALERMEIYVDCVDDSEECMPADLARFFGVSSNIK